MSKIDTRRFTLTCEKCGWEIQGPAFAVLEVGKNHECDE